MTKKFFITGTGTDIGKTFVTCSLIRQLQRSNKTVAAIKPVISGWNETDAHSDTLQILSNLKLPYSAENIDKISPFRYAAPLAPSMAARAEQRLLDYDAMVNFCRNAGNGAEYLLCEGAGGVMVPLTNKTSLHLMQDLDFSVILVGGTYLGALSHILTAVTVLENAGLKIYAVIINETLHGVGLNETISELKNFIKIPIFPVLRMPDNAGFTLEYMGGIFEVE